MQSPKTTNAISHNEVIEPLGITMLNFCKISFVVFIMNMLMLSSGIAARPYNFTSAKKMAKIIFYEHQETLYCACKYNNDNEINLSSCNMQSAASIQRAHRLEWEHMMPAVNLGQHLLCWKKSLCTINQGKAFKGRKCCEKIDEKFRLAESELYNLWPSVGLVNQVRSNYRYSMLPSHKGFYGCPFDANTQLRKVEPADSAKGIVARANLFMADKYNIRLSAAQRKLFEAWDKQFPPSDWEKKWAGKVAEIEGYQNPYISINRQ